MHFTIIPGWRTERKLVILESDDWGGIRMPSREAYSKLIKGGVDLESDEGFRYNKFDSLATFDDLASLFEVLKSVKDSYGRAAVFTPVAVVANPDFVRIRESDFMEYFYEPFTETLKKYPGCENSFSLWKKGIDERLFMPQFHGREHLNVKVWMKALKSGNKKVLQSFDNEMWGISTANDPEIRIEVQAALDFYNPDDLLYQQEVLSSGLGLFEKIFGYRATLFVPPNGILNSNHEHVCAAEGIKYLSSSSLQIEPLGYNRTRRRIHWLGQRDKYGLTILIRNCFFEPCQPGQDWVDSCLKDISIAFRRNRPALVSSHRVNYIGALHKHNRDAGLTQLGLLLKSVMKYWPDTEFITSEELGRIISNEH
jgi:hypothetical protein